jgi:hypothetical protein
MTEEEWLACTDPTPMLEFLGDKASDRKLRLFGCACCRRTWNVLPEESRLARGVMERFADGLVEQEEFQAAGRKANSAAREAEEAYGTNRDVIGATGEAANAVWLMFRPERCLIPWPLVVTDNAADAQAAWACSPQSNWLMEVFKAGERGCQALLFRDIFNPFRHVTAAPSWLAWNGGTVVKLAQGIYEERAFDCLPVLADALEEAGCHDADMLAHCLHQFRLLSLHLRLHVVTLPEGRSGGESAWRKTTRRSPKRRRRNPQKLRN